MLNIVIRVHAHCTDECTKKTIQEKEKEKLLKLLYNLKWINPFNENPHMLCYDVKGMFSELLSWEMVHLSIVLKSNMVNQQNAASKHTQKYIR